MLPSAKSRVADVTCDPQGGCRRVYGVAELVGLSGTCAGGGPPPSCSVAALSAQLCWEQSLKLLLS